MTIPIDVPDIIAAWMRDRNGSSGKFGANAAWLAFQVMAHNLARWVATLGLGAGILSTKRLRRRLFTIVGRLTLHLPGAAQPLRSAMDRWIRASVPPWLAL